MTDLVNEFKAESVGLIEQMVELLEACEEGRGQAAHLDKFAQFSDRIMGAARQIATKGRPEMMTLLVIGKFAQLCKLLGYKTAQLPVQNELFPVAVGVLLDACGELHEKIKGLGNVVIKSPDKVTKTLLERLSWLNHQFNPDIEGGVPIKLVDDLILDLNSDSGK